MVVSFFLRQLFNSNYRFPKVDSRPDYANSSFIYPLKQFFESRPNYHQYSTISNDSGFNRNDQKFRVTSKMLAMKSKSNNNMACITKQLNMVIFY
ncbi:hypothetical protein X798_05256 [Onchocerca flexuosa]|uniref:Uncharacterized protein n=1 Tax=Onchocerca flexuosa TaxID=387005 RepID=A0A238BQQ1_9BILA|nr:hypothetical protein X798_05256 [Onchocerca flexuosa]